jgi:gliding motility-associated-like protein
MGNVLWEKFVGGDYDDELQDLTYGDSSYYLAGSTINYGNGYAHIYLSEMDKKGNFLWFKIFSGGQHEHCNIVRETNDKDLILGVFSRSFGNHSYSFMLVKTDLLGNIKWAKAYLSDKDDVYRDMLITKDNGFLSVGSTNSFGVGGYDFYVLKTDSNGNVLWAKTYGGREDDLAFNIKELSDGNYAVCGESKSFGAGAGDVLIIKISPFGELIWAKTYGGEEAEVYPSFDVLDNDGFIISSQTNSFGKNGDFFLVKTDVDGNSCCSQEIYEVIENTVAVNERVVELNVYEGSEFPTWNVTITNPDVNNTLVCIDSLEIVGDTLLCGNTQGIQYTINPWFDGEYVWEVSGNTTIVSGQGTNSITVDFNGESGYIYVSFNSYCSNSIQDSLFVFAGNSFDVDLGSDTTFCNGNSTILSPGGGYENYLWQDGSTDTLMIAGQAGVYWVKVTDTLGCSATDSLIVRTYPAFEFNLGNDTTICYGDYIFLNGPDGYESYQWQDGSDYISYIADTAGFYWLEVSDTNHCAVRDSLLLTTNLVPDTILGPDTLFCSGGNITLQTNPEYEKYFWQDGSEGHVLVVDEPGKYWVTVFDTLGCSGSDSINLSYFSAVTLELQSAGYLCDDDSVILTAVSNYNNYLWQDSSQSQTCIAKDSGTYWVRVNSPCETKSDTIVIDACSSIWVPNVFTPNNDGYNDYFYAIGKNIPKFKMEIFNRWGQTLKTLYSIDEKWDGTYHGQKMPQGTYFWVADYERIKRDGSTEHVRLQGSVMLMR